MYFLGFCPAFCNGHSIFMNNIILEVRGALMESMAAKSLLVNHFMIFFCQCLVVCEMVLYVILFLDLHKHNQSLEKEKGKTVKGNFSSKRFEPISTCSNFSSSLPLNFLTELVIGWI